jgi:predicted GNAT family acetyltransferase
MDLNYTLTDNEEAKQYEFNIDGLIPRIEYIKSGNQIYLTHTEVPLELEGKGIAKKLVKKVLEDIEQKNLLIIPLCPFVASYIKRNPEWIKLVFKGVKIE